MSWERHPVYRSKPFVISNMTFSRQRPKALKQSAPRSFMLALIFYRRGKRAGVTIVMPWQDDES